MVLHHPHQGRQPWLPAASSGEMCGRPIQATQNDENDPIDGETAVAPPASFHPDLHPTQAETHLNSIQRPWQICPLSPSTPKQLQQRSHEASVHHAHEKQSASSIKPVATIQRPGSSVRHAPAAVTTHHHACSHCDRSSSKSWKTPAAPSAISLPPKPSVPSSIQVDDHPPHVASVQPMARARSSRPSKTHHQDP
ncbi:hypothetical protein ACLOJK_000193 [Asimina triloba]